MTIIDTRLTLVIAYLSIIMTSLLFIGNPPQTRGGIIQVTGGSSADPPQSAAGLKYSAVGL